MIYFKWYIWGPTHLNCHLCLVCWTFWKRYGGLKKASRLADNDIEETTKLSIQPNVNKNNVTEVENKMQEIEAVATVVNHRPHR
jgi:hypothetical protein